MKPFSLYIHIPFCVRKCAYCDFPSWAGKEALVDPYVSALIAEIEEAGRRWSGYRAETVFFGGGTPSVLTGEQMNAIMESVRSAFPLAPEAEISMEMNPGTLTEEKLSFYRLAGINRVSIGAQALNDRLLRIIGRIHTKDEAISAVTMAREAGFENISMDLMYGLPAQSPADFSDTLNTALSLPLTHLSMYSLIVEEGTPLFSRVEAGEEVPGDEETLIMQHEAARLAAANGFDRYEISNYARPGFECRHNLTYWRRGEYLGLGCAAHSMMENARFSNTASLTGYLQGEREAERQALTDTDILEETVMLALRTRDGMDIELYRRLTGRDYARRKPLIDRLVREGMAEERKGRLALTEGGMDVLNAVIEALV